jgi:hypothetical protein
MTAQTPSRTRALRHSPRGARLPRLRGILGGKGPPEVVRKPRRPSLSHKLRYGLGRATTAAKSRTRPRSTGARRIDVPAREPPDAEYTFKHALVGPTTTPCACRTQVGLKEISWRSPARYCRSRIAMQATPRNTTASRSETQFAPQQQQPWCRDGPRSSEHHPIEVLGMPHQPHSAESARVRSRSSPVRGGRWRGLRARAVWPRRGVRPARHTPCHEFGKACRYLSADALFRASQTGPFAWSCCIHLIAELGRRRGLRFYQSA